MLGDKLADGEIDALILLLILAEGETEAEALGDSLADTDGLTEADGDMLADLEELTLSDTLGDIDALTDGLSFGVSFSAYAGI